MPLVSGIINITKSNWNPIIMAKNRKTIPAPIVENNTGTKEGTTAANIQCTELPMIVQTPLND